MNRGVSLVEMILALALTGLVIVFFLGLLPTTALMQRRAEQQVAATYYAKELSAHLESTAFARLKASTGALTPAAPGVLEGALQERKLDDGTILVPEVQLRLLPPADRLVEATITVRWQSGRKNLTHRTVRNFSSILR